MKTYSQIKIELRKLQVVKKMLDKSSQFLSSEQPSERKAWMLPWILQELKNYARRTCDCGQPGGHSKICVLCGQWFSNQFEIVSETPFGCDTVGLELKWAALCSLLCPETDWNIRIGKQQLFWDCEKLNLLNELISIKFSLLGLLNSRLSNGSRFTKTNFVLGLVSLRCPLLE